MVVLGEEAVSDERGTPVVLRGLDGSEYMVCDTFEYEVSVWSLRIAGVRVPSMLEATQGHPAESAPVLVAALGGS